MFWTPWFSFQPYPSFTLNHNVLFFEIPRFLDTCSPDTLLGHVCGSLQFIPQSSVVLPSFFVIYILPFPLFIHFIDHFLWNTWLSCSPVYLSTLPMKTLIVSGTHFLILFQCTSTFPLSHSAAPSFFSRVGTYRSVYTHTYIYIHLVHQYSLISFVYIC